MTFLRSTALAAIGGLKLFDHQLGIADNNLLLEVDTLYVTDIAIFGTLTLVLPVVEPYSAAGRRIGITVQDASVVQLQSPPSSNLLRYGQTDPGVLLQGQYILESGTYGGFPAWFVRDGETAFGNYPTAQPTGLTNVLGAVAIGTGQWSRAGKVLTVSGYCEFQPSTPGINTEVLFPVAAGQGSLLIDGGFHCGGTAVARGLPSQCGSFSFYDASNTILRIVPPSPLLAAYDFIFSYRVV
jgi:hypothetical protein